MLVENDMKSRPLLASSIISDCHWAAFYIKLYALSFVLLSYATGCYRDVNTWDLDNKHNTNTHVP